MRHYVTSSRYDGMKKSEARRLPRLEEEHQWPKRLVGDQAWDSRVLKGVSTATMEQFEQAPEGTVNRQGCESGDRAHQFLMDTYSSFFRP
jgi:hypothetical protein